MIQRKKTQQATRNAAGTFLAGSLINCQSNSY